MNGRKKVNGEQKMTKRGKKTKNKSTKIGLEKMAQ